MSSYTPQKKNPPVPSSFYNAKTLAEGWRNPAHIDPREPRVGKTVSVVDWIPMGVHVVPNLSPASEVLQTDLEEDDKAIVSSARSLEKEYRNRRPDLSTTTVSGNHKCPGVRHVAKTLSPQRLDEEHQRSCGDRHLPPEDSRWRTGSIYLDDYDAIFSEGYCPIRVAKNRARNLRFGEVIICTGLMLEMMADEIIAGAPAELLAGGHFWLAYDEFHRPSVYIAGSVTVASWKPAARPAPMKIPADVPANARRLVEDVLALVGYGLEMEPRIRNDVELRDALYQLQHFVRQDGGKGGKNRKATLSDAQIDDWWAGKSKLLDASFIGQRLPPDFLAQIKKRRPGRSPGKDWLEERRTYRDAYIGMCRADALRQELSVDEFMEGLSGTYRGAFFDPEHGRIGWKDDHAFGQLRKWCLDHDGDSRPFARLAGFLLSLSRQDVFLVPLPRRAAPKRSSKDGVAVVEQGKRSIDLWACYGEMTTDGPRYGLPAVAKFQSAGAYVRLLSGTMMPEHYIESRGVAVQPWTAQDGRPPPILTFVPEVGATRGARSRMSAQDRRAFDELLRELFHQSKVPLHFFIQTVKDTGTISRDVLDGKADCQTFRSFRATSVQFGEGVIVAAGVPYPPIDLSWALLFGEDLEAMPLGKNRFATGLSSHIVSSSYQTGLRLALAEVVQAGYRCSTSGEESFCIVLGVNEEVKDRLARLLVEWGHLKASVAKGVYKTMRGQKATAKKARQLLDMAKVPVRSPEADLRRLAEWMENEIRRGTADREDIQAKGYPPFRAGGPLPSRDEKRAAWSLLRGEKRIVKRSGRWTAI